MTFNSKVDLSMQYQRNPLLYAIKNTIGTGLVIGMLESFLIAYTIQNALDTMQFSSINRRYHCDGMVIVEPRCGLIAGTV